MYIPKQYKVEDFREIEEFIQNNSFGTVVTTDQGRPLATHLPVQMHKRGDDYYITGHMAHTNPQWRTFPDEQGSVLVMFQGPHAYISSSWYQSEEVPTWNYQAIHVYGAGRILSEQELQEDLMLLLQKYEQGRKNAVLWETLSSQTKKQIAGIVGFEVKVQDVQAAYKLSQNRSAEDYHHIVSKLHQEKDGNSRLVAEAMKARI
ncbi:MULTISPECIES: FMN-binding negative transcriptional regulator [Sporosarcina]|uniref:FMN-binding negative transcriptional regulator n=1 Tax=Sporosarcina TaxID=1569 RepID=UPI0005903DA5|nr:MULTISPECIES: FMN-binding negative transcriptional regulator [Sporosarcina]WJY26828.1 FMN-binding negative transcriptional regulator [Sporosarcina sp. 0.2-SM1T-5]